MLKLLNRFKTRGVRKVISYGNTKECVLFNEDNLLRTQHFHHLVGFELHLRLKTSKSEEKTTKFELVLFIDEKLLTLVQIFNSFTS